ncbi:CsbD family protein [Streptococcus oriscaviae]|uniref:CsbD family protein n=1 Tax=Streptococcus oriscaviae TaxID=2781599 RepID=A0ABX7YMN6_9STRE|nr:CsbD family protein [Streptococcus oriscaviae]QUE55093.1 CsbD family protein [Streptococcus oriscaviae]
MSKEKRDAKLEQVTGSVKKGIGKLTGNKKLEVEGMVEKGVGKAKEMAIDAKESVEGAIKGIKKALDKD